MKFDLVFISNLESNRIDAEISFKRWYKRYWEIAAIVYKHNNEFIVEYCSDKNNINIDKYIEEAKSGLLDYVNCEGVQIEDEASRATHSLTLMLKTDGTSMGEKFGVNQNT